MAQVLQIFDGGIVRKKGKLVGVIHFLISTNEGSPEQLTGYCQPNFRDSIIKNLKRLAWQKAGTTIETAKPDEETENP